MDYNFYTKLYCSNYLCKSISLHNWAPILQIGLMIFILIQGIKRMHDVDNSGWYILIPIFSLFLLFTDGTVGPNRFGDDPKGRLKDISTA
ncbi:MAG: hypothetical protein A2V93_02655 [Ignavibacteria bacterium RBG_16_34_14]|nr:MAG: hypothetical protein A2V93_02655 [Ignavibacteria bacterium RBG_16_34_14]